MNINEFILGKFSSAALVGVSGALTGLSAGDVVFSFRNISSRTVILRRAGLGFLTTTAFGTAQIVDFGLYVARGFTASDTNQTAIATTNNNGKRRTGDAVLSSVDIRISNTGAITGGTKTVDANATAVVAGWSGGLGQGITPSPWNLFDVSRETAPLILQKDEGFVIKAISAFGASGVGKLYVSAELQETDPY